MPHWHECAQSNSDCVVWTHEQVVASTQDTLKTLIADDHTKPLGQRPVRVVSAATQTHGRGQRGRSWLSPEGSLAMSCGFPWRGVDSPKLPYVALAASMGVVDVLERSALSPQIKWANDILLDEKKLGGVLVETFSFSNDSTSAYVLIGIGLNVHNTLIETLVTDQPVTSLRAHCTKNSVAMPDILSDLGAFRNALFNAIWMRLHTIIHPSRISGGVRDLVASVDKRLAFRGKKIRLETETESLICYLEGLNEEGHLSVRRGATQETHRVGRVFRLDS